MGIRNLLNFGKFKINKSYLKEVQELVADVKQMLKFENVEYKFLAKDRAIVSANKGKNTFNATLDFPKNRMEQTITTSCHKMDGSSIPEVQNRATTIGTIDGIPKIRTNFEMRTGEDTSLFRETTSYENLLTGNTYRRVLTPQGCTIQKLINGNYVNLFPKP